MKTALRMSEYLSFPLSLVPRACKISASPREPHIMTAEENQERRPQKEFVTFLLWPAGVFAAVFWWRLTDLWVNGHFLKKKTKKTTTTTTKTKRTKKTDTVLVFNITVATGHSCLVIGWLLLWSVSSYWSFRCRHELTSQDDLDRIFKQKRVHETVRIHTAVDHWQIYIRSSPGMSFPCLQKNNK